MIGIILIDDTEELILKNKKLRRIIMVNDHGIYRIHTRKRIHFQTIVNVALWL